MSSCPVILQRPAAFQSVRSQNLSIQTTAPVAARDRVDRAESSACSTPRWYR